MKVNLERFRKLRKGTPHYDGCLDSIVKELVAARKVVEASRANVGLLKRLLEKANIDLVIDLNGKAFAVDVTSDILKEISNYDRECNEDRADGD